ncbi:MAG: tetratricopeptide repeat protein [Myxococcota bacterium]
MRVALMSVVFMSGWLTSVTLTASAQSETPRSLFEAGSAALREGRPVEALSLFRRSFALENRASTAWALAVTLQEVRQVTEAIDLYDRLLDGEFGEPPVPEAQIEEVRAAALASQSELVIRVRGDFQLGVEVDGGLRGAVMPGASLTVRVDPGAHRVRGVGDDRTTGEQNITMAPGERTDVELALRRVPRVLPESPGPELDATLEPGPEEEGASVLPWVLGVGAGVLVAAAAVIAIVLVTQPADSELFAEGPFPSVEALRSP